MVRAGYMGTPGTDEREATVKLGEGTVRRAAQNLAKNPSSYAFPTITPA